ncbi:MAG: GyrI-like domain-containing protein [Massilia sp.]|nr:GyrI-like domain-containing protein [Massilia sp.]
MTLGAPRIEDKPAMEIAGLSAHFDSADNHSIPDLWRRFAPYIGRVAGQIGHASYGVMYIDDAGEMAYLSGIEVAEGIALPSGFVQLRVPEGRYAVFLYSGHVSAIRAAWNQILDEWLPASGYGMPRGPSLERYDERFDAASASGEIELWLPLS